MREVFECLSCGLSSSVCVWGGLEELIWAASWASDPAEIQGISCSVWRLHNQPHLASLLSFTFVLDPPAYPNPLSLFSSRCLSSHAITIFSMLLRHIMSFCLPELSIFFFFYSLDFCSSPPRNQPLLPPLIPPSFPFFFVLKSLRYPREEYGSDEHGEPGTNQSIDLSTYPLLCPSDRQQKTKCLLSETFPISLYLPSPSYSPPFSW